MNQLKVRFAIQKATSVAILGAFFLSTFTLLFQNCSNVHFSGVNSQASVLSVASCQYSTTPQPFTSVDGSKGTCECNADGANVCTITSCGSAQATLTNGVCVLPSTLTTTINGQSSISLLPSSTPVNVVITPTGPIQGLIQGDSAITDIAGSCLQTTLTPSQLGLLVGSGPHAGQSSSTFTLGNQTFTYTPSLAQNIAGCTWKITVVSNNGVSSSATFTALLCTAGALNPTTPTCTTVEGQPGKSYCTQNGLGYQCVPNPVLNCTYNGQTVASGSSVTGYATATVPYGQTCQPQTLTCANGVLSGASSYPNNSCTVLPGAACSFNGQSVATGSSVTGYTTSTVPYGQTCQSGQDTCDNGNLIGGYPSATCSVGSDPDCNVNGQPLPNGQSVTYYAQASVPYGQTCASQTLTCTNGVVSGGVSGQGYYTAPSCTVTPAASCNYQGQTIASGSSVTTYPDTVVPYGQTCQPQTSTCNNGVFSGPTYNYPACQVGPPASCSYNGQIIASGATVTGYATSSVPYGQTCQPSSATCTNGVLSGTVYPTCSVGSDPNCYLDGQTIPDGGSITTYPSLSVPYGQNCQPQVETCSNGTLSGTNTALTCSVQPPANCVFNGSPVLSGSSVTGYFATSVPYGQTCTSESRVCTNGTLSGSAQYTGCSVNPPASCTFNGQSIADGTSVTAYSSPSVPYGSTCQQETATCSNGVLPLDSGYTYASCTVQAPACSPDSAAETIPYSSWTLSSASFVSQYNHLTSNEWQTNSTNMAPCTSSPYLYVHAIGTSSSTSPRYQVNSGCQVKFTTQVMAMAYYESGSFQGAVQWFDSSGNLISTSSPSSLTNVVSNYAWNQCSTTQVVATAPSNAASAQLILQSVNLKGNLGDDGANNVGATTFYLAPFAVSGIASGQ